MKTFTMARRLLLCGCIAMAAMLGTAGAGDETLASKLGFTNGEQACTDQACGPAGANADCCPTGHGGEGCCNGACGENCTAAGGAAPADCVPAVYQGTSKSTVNKGWFKQAGWFGNDHHAADNCTNGAACHGEGCASGHGGCCHNGAGCNPANGHACCINQTGSCANGTCTCDGCKNGTGCKCCGTGQYAGNGHSGYGCKCGPGCKCGRGLHNDGLLGKMFGTRSNDCRCGPGCRCGLGNGHGHRFLADLNGDGRYDSAGKGRCRHCGRYGNLFGLGHCRLCCGIPLPGIPLPGLLAHGRHGALGGSYARVYAVNPYHHDFRDGAVYAAQGYNAPIAVPLAPNVDYQWNYGWGIPSSRLTPVSRVVPSPYAVQPTYAVPAGYAPAGGQPQINSVDEQSDS